MNFENLHELINRYEQSLDTIYGPVHDELFKWRAMKTWQQEWFKPDDAFDSFGARFNAARKDLSLLVDNSRMHPSTGVVKIWEQEPDTIEHLFLDVLFADAHGNASEAQSNMDSFLDDYEGLRQKYFPRNWSYKQDRHSASVFLSMMKPDFNYIYKSSEALTMARYIDLGLDIGSGIHFKLDNYYRMCNGIISALQEHKTLLDQHFNRLDDKCYNDYSLHLLTFDLMYCCRTYNFYKGLTIPSSIQSKQKRTLSLVSSEDLAQKETEHRNRIKALEQEINILESVVDECEDINLVGVQVFSKQYGSGTVIRQEINKIDVQFESIRKRFILDKKYPIRPRFEDDNAIIEAFSAYSERLDKIKALKLQLDRLCK